MFYRVCCVMVLVGTCLRGNVRFDVGHAKWQSIWWAEISEPLMRKTVTWFKSWASQFVKLMRILSSIKLGPILKLISFFVSGSFKHARTRGNAVATTARVNPNTLVSRRLQNDRLHWMSIFKRQGSTTCKAYTVWYSITATVMFGWAAQTPSVMVHAQDNFSPV